MSGWSHGYVTDIEYLRVFHREQAPVHIDVTCLLNGVEPPTRDGPTAYCDLGCGTGYGVTLLATANPAMEFWGVDFNPAHIARGRALKAKLGLDNLHLVEAAFSELTGPDAPPLPLFDYIVMHGVYTWIAKEQRSAIVAFIDRHLKPGGAVYVAYNALPGWIHELPIQRLLWEHAQLSQERSDRAVGLAVAFLRRMADAGAGMLSQPSQLKRFEELTAEGSLPYLAHEYINRHWEPIYHRDLVDDLAPAKLSWIGSGTLLENFADLAVMPAQRQLLDEIRDPAVRETFRDYLMPRAFRRDVFLRGVRRLRDSERAARLREIRLALAVPPDELRYEMKVPIGESRLNERLYRPVFEALAQGPATVGELLELPALKALPTASPVEIVGMLMVTEQAQPLVNAPDTAARAKAVALNRLAVADALAESHSSTLIGAPATGTGLLLIGTMLVAYPYLAQGIDTVDALIAALRTEMAERNLVVRADGQPVADQEKAAAVLRSQAERVIARIPTLRALGAV